MILLQFGMGVGNIQSCIDLSREVEPLLGHVNQYLDDRPDELQEELDDTVEAAMALANGMGKKITLKEALAILEEAIRKNPDQWLWYHDRWRHLRA